VWLVLCGALCVMWRASLNGHPGAAGGNCAAGGGRDNLNNRDLAQLGQY
jgi:hypothetical protein